MLTFGRDLQADGLAQVLPRAAGSLAARVCRGHHPDPFVDCRDRVPLHLAHAMHLRTCPNGTPRPVSRYRFRGLSDPSVHPRVRSIAPFYPIPNDQPTHPSSPRFWWISVGSGRKDTVTISKARSSASAGMVPCNDAVSGSIILCNCTSYIDVLYLVRPLPRPRCPARCCSGPGHGGCSHAAAAPPGKRQHARPTPPQGGSNCGAAEPQHRLRSDRVPIQEGRPELPCRPMALERPRGARAAAWEKEEEGGRAGRMITSSRRNRRNGRRRRRAEERGG